MNVAGFVGVVGLGLALCASAGVSGGMAAEADLSAFQGAWLQTGPSCTEVYTAASKGVSFKTPVDIFAPAFIISGNRLRTPLAACRIKSVKPTGDRQVLALDCANAVSTGEVKVHMVPSPDGSLKRYFNDQDTSGTTYQRCFR
jgi:hypothetical protein